jgi:hypothetical protein
LPAAPAWRERQYDDRLGWIKRGVVPLSDFPESIVLVSIFLSIAIQPVRACMAIPFCRFVLIAKTSRRYFEIAVILQTNQSVK